MRRKQLLLAAVLLALCALGPVGIRAAAPAENTGDNSAPFAAAVKENGKWGAVDQAGKTIVPVEYDKVGLTLSDQEYREADMESEPDRDSFIEVEKDDLRGFYNRQGKMIVPVSYTSRSFWKEGCLAAQNKNKKIGFFKEDGTVLAPYQYEKASDFSNGMAIIEKDDLYGFLKSDGTEIKPAYKEARYFQDGAAPVKQNGKWGVIDTDGHFVIPPAYQDTGPHFDQGLLAVKEKGLWGFIDGKGQYVVPAQFKAVHPLFSEGYTAVQSKDKLWGFMDKNGQITAEPQFKNVLTPFSEGLAGVTSTDGNAYAKPDGTIAFMAAYDELFPFKDGIAEVREGEVHPVVQRSGIPISIGIGWGNWFHHHHHHPYFGWGIGIPAWGWDPWGWGWGWDGGWYEDEVLPTVLVKRGYIDNTGKVIADPSNDHVFPITPKGILIENHDRYGWVNRSGQFTAHITYRTLIPDLEASVLAAQDENKKWGLVSMTDGKELTPFTYDKIEVKGSGLYSYKQDGKWGIINQNGTVLTEPLYSAVGMAGDGLIPAKIKGSWTFLDENGQAAFDISGKIEDATPFFDGFAGFKQKGKWGIIDKQGKVVVSPVYDDFYLLH